MLSSFWSVVVVELLGVAEVCGGLLFTGVYRAIQIDARMAKEGVFH